MSFFSHNAMKLAPLGLEGKAQYRECQVGAAWATLAHFTTSTEPALISMPTGSGKTALMMMLSFLMKAERVIVITPSVALRGQVANKFGTLADLIKIDALPTSCPKPKVLEHAGQLKSNNDWKTFLSKDVVSATPHTTSPGYEEITAPKATMFGPDTIVFFDEAHHSRARTWKKLIEAFINCRIVLLTATPFRNDNRRLLAKLVYHYPMRKALESGIYAPITYHNVDPTDIKNKDFELCKKAVAVFNKHRIKHKNARLLIRAEGVTQSEALLKLYGAEKLNVKEVNYKKTFQDNETTLTELRVGKLDGVVCVDQIGEGLDIPSLKVAVLHKPRQSFPATVQFVGRICREATAEIGDPQLIACADDVRGPLQRLYLHDNAWRDFLPDLVEKVIGKIRKRTAFHGVVDVESELDISPEDIQPFFSARVYEKATRTACRFDDKLDLRDDVMPVFLDNQTDKDMLVIVTGIEKTVPWAEEAGLSTPHFDLHVFYWHKTNRRLFEYTTSDKIATMIRSSLWGKSLRRINAAAVAKALQETATSQYLMFGMSNLAHGSGSVPSYKTYMGTEVEGAVRPTDSRSFTAGHALAKYSTGETRGIGSNHARIWSIQRASLCDFKMWCDRVSKCLAKTGDSRLPNVEFLSAPQPIAEFPEEPLAAYVRWEPATRITFNTNTTLVDVDSISVEKLQLINNNQALTGKITMGNEHVMEQSDFTYTLAAPHWTFARADLPSLKVDDGQEVHFCGLIDFLGDYPPTFVLADGSAVIGNCRYNSARSLPPLPLECFDTGKNWSGCDIFVEFEHHDTTDSTNSRIPARGKLSVHDQLEEWLKLPTPASALVIKDHATGEIADFIEINVSEKLIRLYHCKACAPNKKPGARISELNVIEQVLRSVDRVGTNSLISDLHDRVIGTNRPNTKMIKGTDAHLATLTSTFHANEWRFEVVVVNPGIDCKRTRQRKNTKTLLTTCYEWLAAANTTFRIIGS